MFIDAPSLVLTKKVPITDAKTPILETIIGRTTKSLVMLFVAATASAIVAISDPAYDSNKSALIPAVSPTISPTLSAIVAGFLGSSSGNPASTFPTKSAPTSAAFV